MTAELVRLRREQLKPALRLEFHALCSADCEHSQLLYGEDLAKKVRDAKETNRLGKTLGTAKDTATTALASVKVLGPLIPIALTNRPTWVVAILPSNIFCQEEPAHHSARRGTRSQRGE